MTDAVPPKTKLNQIVDVAQTLMRGRGYAGFSFRDVAAEVGIRSASIHHHFPTKADLGQRAMAQYREAFSEALNGLAESHAPAHDRLRAYANVFVSTLAENGGVCMGGMLASDSATLPDAVNAEVTAFFEAQYAWIAEVLTEGQSAGDLDPTKNADALARLFVSGLEGGMIIANATGDVDQFRKTSDQLVAVLTD